jgi:predicted GH43/DUF377 family glycosyl hydrolase
MDEWQLGPFTRRGRILQSHPELPWAAKDLFNPGAVVRDGRVHLLVRGEDMAGRYAGVSRIGLAVSDDGFAFQLHAEPVLAPGDDQWAPWEAAGGCEDPRIVERPGGGYVCLYTGFDGKAPTLMTATSDDLYTWIKHGPAFASTPYARRSSKSGAVVTEIVDGRLIAALIDGRYWMYWGEGMCFAATSDDLVRWKPLEFDAGRDHYLTREGESWTIHRVSGQRALRPMLFPRRKRFDSLLVEPGPPALRTDNGILLVYNGADVDNRVYQVGQALFDRLDPTACVARAAEPFLGPKAEEHQGQVPDVCFAQSLVLFRSEWLLYYGMADSSIGCAVAPAI